MKCRTVMRWIPTLANLNTGSYYQQEGQDGPVSLTWLSDKLAFQFRRRSAKLISKIAAILDFWLDRLIVLGFNETSTLVGHFVSSPREREKRDKRDCRRDERERQVRKTNKNKSKETEEIKHSPSTLTCYKGNRPCPVVSQYQLDAPVT